MVTLLHVEPATKVKAVDLGDQSSAYEREGGEQTEGGAAPRPQQDRESGHPLRKIRAVVNDALRLLNAEFDRLYAKEGRPSIAPERLTGPACCRSSTRYLALLGRLKVLIGKKSIKSWPVWPAISQNAAMQPNFESICKIRARGGETWCLRRAIRFS